VSATLITGIGELVTNDVSLGDGSPLGIVRDAALVIEGERVAWVGEAAGAPAADERVDVGGRAVVPGFVDSHTHLVFAGERSAEFAARMAGEPYTGGGIMTTVRRPGRRRVTSCVRVRAGSPTRCSRSAPPPSRSRAATGSPLPTR
jgi:imidazolonepropionase